MNRRSTIHPGMKPGVMGTLALVAASCLAMALGRVQAGPSTAEDVPADLASLVPSGSNVYVHFESIDAVNELSSRLSRAFGEGTDPGIEDMFEQFMDLEFVDTTRPIGLAIDAGSLMTGMPDGAFIVPATEVEPLIGSLQPVADTAAPVVEGSYVGVPMSPSYTRGEGPSVMTRGLLPGEISLRLDLVAILETFQPVVDGWLEELDAVFADPQISGAAGMDVSSLLELYLDGARSFLDSAEELDLALDGEGDRLELSTAFTTREGSPLAGFAADSESDLRWLMGYPDPDASVVFGMGMGWSVLYEEMKPFMDEVLAIYPGPLRAALQAYMESYEEIVGLLKGGVSGTFDFAPTGMRFAYYLGSEDPEAVISKSMEILESGFLANLGIVNGETEHFEVAGFEVKRVTFDVDYDAMLAAMAEDAGDEFESEEFQELMRSIYGEDGLQLAFAAGEEVVAMVMGGDDTYLRDSMSALKRDERKLPADLERAVAAAEAGRMGYVARMDIARFMSSIFDLVVSMEGMHDEAEFMPDLSGLSTNLIMHGSMEGRVWRGSVGVNVAEISALVDALQDD